MTPPAPDDTGYASWDETLTLRETIQALENTMDDYEQQTTQQGYLLGNVIDEFRKGIATLNARVDRIEKALIDSGRLSPLPSPTRATLISDFSDDEL